MQLNPGGSISVVPGERITFTVKRIKDTPCKAGWVMNGWGTCDPEQQPDDQTRVRVCTAPPTTGAKCTATVTVDFRKDDQGTFDPDEEYDVTIQGQTGQPFTTPFSPPPVINGQTFHFEVS